MMPKRRMWWALAGAALICLGAQFAVPAAADSPAPPKPESQATLTRLGFGISRITLHEKAAKRLDIQTAPIRADGSGRKVVPFSAVIYDLDGHAWVYTVPAPLTYVRQPVVIEIVEGEEAWLYDGPAAGTLVVTVGVPELYGTEVGVNGE